MISVAIKPLLERLNGFCRTGLESAAGSCVARSHYEITVEHLLWQLIDHPKSDLSLILSHFGIAPDSARAVVSRVLEEYSTGNSAKPVFSPRLIEWFQEALLIATVEFGEESIRSGALVLAFLSKGGQLGAPEIVNFFKGLDKEELSQQFSTIVAGSIETKGASKRSSTPSTGGGKTALSKYCEDFTEKARSGKIDPVFGRDAEIRQVVDIFARRRKNNPIVVGEAGVGKTAIVEGLALRITEGDVPDFLKDVSLLGLDMGLLQAGAGMKGEFEKRLQQVIEEVKASEKPIILFIDEAHTMIGAGGNAGGSDAANLLKPALARGELRTVAATTWSEYKKYFEKDAALARRFQLVHLEEPSEETALLILRGLKDKYEHSHGVIIRDDAVKAAAEMSHRYISGRYLPDKAIDLLDTSAARVKVLMTGKPDAVETVERRLQALKRERSALERDDVYGNQAENERLAEIDAELNALEQERISITERWKKEQQLVAALMDARENLYLLKTDEAAQEAIEPSDEVAAELEAVEEVPIESEDALLTRIEELHAELDELQTGGALVQSEVCTDIVAQVVSDWTGIPAGKMMHDEAGDILELENNLKQRVKGQDAALRNMCEIIKASKAGLKDPSQPLGVFLLTGPSGVGKTETGLAIAELLFGGERFAVSINMSEFQEKHTVSRLIGSPPGYVGYGEGGVLTEAVRQRPYSVVLLDECEKANTDVMNLFYQVFDKGTLSDGEGRNINFRNTIILLTSNLASEQIAQLRAQQPEITNDAMTAAIRPILSDHFKPALLARMSIVPFTSLNEETMREIVHLKLQKVVARMKDAHNVTLEITEAVKDQIAARCLEVETGARNIDHIMNGTVLPLLSQEILQRMSEGELPPLLTLDVGEESTFCIVNGDQATNKE